MLASVAKRCKQLEALELQAKGHLQFERFIRDGPYLISLRQVSDGALPSSTLSQMAPLSAALQDKARFKLIIERDFAEWAVDIIARDSELF